MEFDRSLEPHYGVEERLSPLVARLLAPNPGPFTFKGTGVHIVGGGRKESVAVIDPGPDLPEHIAALTDALNGRRVSHILITHTHRDHSPAAAALKAATGAKTYGFGPHPSFPLRPAHGTAASGLSATEVGSLGPARLDEAGDRDFVPDILVRDGDVLDGEGFTLECVHTPGHISNHMCYALKQEAALFTGDHVMGWSTTVVAPPEGDMGAYMRSLEKLIGRGEKTLYPTHGSPIVRPDRFLRALLTHRRLREAQIRACLADGTDEIAAIVARLYAEVEPGLRKAAAQMVRAHLEQMRSEGRVRQTGGRWHLSG